MNESAQQALQIGVNVTIFVVALTVAISLIVGVRNVAEKASEYNESIPEGSRTLSIESQDVRSIKGYELLAYYANYMSRQAQITASGKYIITIESKYGREIETYDENIDEDDEEYTEPFLEDVFNHINLNSKYEVLINKYDKENETLMVRLKEI